MLALISGSEHALGLLQFDFYRPDLLLILAQIVGLLADIICHFYQVLRCPVVEKLVGEVRLGHHVDLGVGLWRFLLVVEILPSFFKDDAALPFARIHYLRIRLGEGIHALIHARGHIEFDAQFVSLEVTSLALVG